VTRLAAMLLALCVSCSPEEPAPVEIWPTVGASPAPSASVAVPAPGPRTPNEFYAAGVPTFVAGTLGDEHEDRVIRGQIELIRGMLFPTAKVVDDTSIDVKSGAAAWPANAVLYGGPQHNAVIAALAGELPFRMTGDSLELDGHKLNGAGIQLIALVPARSADIAHPSFLLYAGTGREGVAEINGMPHGENGLAIYDAFDSIAGGGWQIGANGFTPQLNWAPPRKALDDTSHDLQGGAAKVTITTVPGASYEDLPAQKAAVTKGLETSLKKLDIDAPTEVRVVIYPNAESKKAFTHSAGDGHAVPAARTLHVRAVEAKGLERLIAHEATHVYTQQVWGPPGTAFVGEGLAVWVSGQYGGSELVDWKKRLDKRAPIATLLGVGFRQRPERETYPQAGITVGALIDLVGLAKLRREVWPATPEGWQAACERAGITSEKLDKATR
jgi:hypothetical protein